MGGYPEEGMPLLATVDPVWIRCGCAVGVPKAVYACLQHSLTLDKRITLGNASKEVIMRQPARGSM